MITEQTPTKTFTEAGFQRDVLDSTQPVLVDFFADSSTMLKNRRTEM